MDTVMVKALKMLKNKKKEEAMDMDMDLIHN
jgi:hypothetical protein